jgi:hypothetical protein
MALGWLALGFFVVAVALALLKVTAIGLICVAVGGLISLVALCLEYGRRRQTQRAVDQGGEPVFSDVGTFGGPRSRQTHTPMM